MKANKFKTNNFIIIPIILVAAFATALIISNFLSRAGVNLGPIIGSTASDCSACSWAYGACGCGSNPCERPKVCPQNPNCNQCVAATFCSGCIGTTTTTSLPSICDNCISWGNEGCGGSSYGGSCPVGYMLITCVDTAAQMLPCQHCISSSLCQSTTNPPSTTTPSFSTTTTSTTTPSSSTTTIPPASTTTTTTPPSQFTFSSFTCDDTTKVCSITYDNNANQPVNVALYLLKNQQPNQITEIQVASGSGTLNAAPFSCSFLPSGSYKIMFQVFLSSDISYSNPILSPTDTATMACP